MFGTYPLIPQELSCLLEDAWNILIESKGYEPIWTLEDRLMETNRVLGAAAKIFDDTMHVVLVVIPRSSPLTADSAQAMSFFCDPTPGKVSLERDTIVVGLRKFLEEVGSEAVHDYFRGLSRCDPVRAPSKDPSFSKT